MQEITAEAPIKAEQMIFAENDYAWKEILRLHLKEFLEFFWIEAYEAID